VSGGGEQTAEHLIIIADTKTITLDPDLRIVWSGGVIGVATVSGDPGIVWSGGVIGGATVSGDPDLHVPANTHAGWHRRARIGYGRGCSALRRLRALEGE